MSYKKFVVFVPFCGSCTDDSNELLETLHALLAFKRQFVHQRPEGCELGDAAGSTIVQLRVGWLAEKRSKSHFLLSSKFFRTWWQTELFFFLNRYSHRLDKVFQINMSFSESANILKYMQKRIAPKIQIWGIPLGIMKPVGHVQCQS